MTPHKQPISEHFGEVIFAYSRAQAVADGEQVEVTKTAQKPASGFSCF